MMSHWEEDMKKVWQQGREATTVSRRGVSTRESQNRHTRLVTKHLRSSRGIRSAKSSLPGTYNEEQLKVHHTNVSKLTLYSLCRMLARLQLKIASRGYLEIKIDRE